MDIHELAAVAAARAGHGEPWLEFIRYPALSVGLYVLEPGEPDRQSPHTEDEIYYVVEGRGRITVGAEVRPVGPGGRLRRDGGPPPLPRHHRAPDPARGLRAGRGLAGLDRWAP